MNHEDSSAWGDGWDFKKCITVQQGSKNSKWKWKKKRKGVRKEEEGEGTQEEERIDKKVIENRLLE